MQPAIILVYLSYAVALIDALYVSAINECPKITNHRPATDVNSLRINDIEIIAAMGDSITAGMLVKNTEQDVVDFSTFIEYRGESFIMGGNVGASSIANYVKHFQPIVYGASIKQKPARLCKETLFCLDSHHDPEIDRLNAAQSGATSDKLLEQVNYLTKYFGYGTPHVDKWKLINLMIGYNDASAACLTKQNAADFKNNVKTSLIQLIKNTDYAFINLIGLMKYDEISHITDKNPNYRKKFKDNLINVSDYECVCCSRPKAGNPNRNELIKGYNKALSEIADELNDSTLTHLTNTVFRIPLKKVAIAFQPMDTDMSSIPYYAISNVDGFHPNEHSAKYLSRRLWNQMFLSADEKTRTSTFNASLPLFCPTKNSFLKAAIRLV